jgi:hypothetical protein
MGTKRIFNIVIILLCIFLYYNLSEGQTVFVEPEENSRIVYGKYVSAKFKVPEEYYGKHLKGVFYFTDKISGKKYYLSNRKYPIWFDQLEKIDYIHFNSNTKILEVLNPYLVYLDENGNALYSDERSQNQIIYLPAGEYLINFDIYNVAGSLIRNYVGGPFKIIEPSGIRRSSGTQTSTGQTQEENPLTIEEFFVQSADPHSGGVNLNLSIRGKTKDGTPVARYCNGGVCGGKITANIIIIDPGKDFGNVFVTTSEIKPNRLKSNPDVPSTFGTFNDSLRITINYPPGSYRIVMKLKLEKADEKTLTYEILQATGSSGFGSGNVEAGTPPIYLISPKENDIFVSGKTFELKWGKQGVIKTRSFYSTDKGTTWAKIFETSDSNYNWLVPHEYTEWGKIKFQWYNYQPEEGGNLFKEEIVNIKIRGIELTAPKKGEILKPGSSYAIKWKGGSNQNLKVKLFWGSTADTLITCTSNDGVQNWLVPNTIPAPTIEVKAILVEDCSQNKSYGESRVEGVIISNPWISFLSPNYLEKVSSGSTITISYVPKVPQGFSTTGKVSLFYRFSGDSSWIRIGTNLPTTHNIQWETPSVTQDKTLIIKAIWEHPVGDMVEKIEGETTILIKKASGQFMR